MTTDSRKLQLEGSFDASGVKAGTQEAKEAVKDLAQSVAKSGQEAAKSLDGIGDGAGSASAKVDRATSNLIGSIQRATAAAEAGKKSGSAFYESLANQRGVSVDVLRPYLDQLDAATAKQKAATAAAVDFSKATAASSAFVGPLQPAAAAAAASVSTPSVNGNALQPAIAGVDAYTKSVKQLAMQHQIAAVQVKDFFEQVISGGSPLRAFAQQGAAVVSNYGGVGETFKALGGLLTPLRVSLGATAAAVVTLGIAYQQGAKESQEYNKALILTGNYLGLTVSRLQDYAKAISSTVGTQGAAADALTALARSGKVATQSLTDVGTAVVLMNRVLGTSVDQATETFTKLADEPTKASAKLNESMHYLNLATYERIRALEEQGDKEAAAALAQKTLAQETTLRLQKVEASAGTLERAWRTLTDGAKGAWDAMLGIGRQQSIGDALGQAQAKLAESKAQAARGPLYAGLYAASIDKQSKDVAELSRRAMREQENAYAEGEKARDNAAKIAASDRLKTLSDEVKTNADKRKKAIEELNRDFKTLGKATSGPEYDKLVANINEKFKDPKGETAKAYQDDAATRMLESLRQQEATLKEQLSTDEKLTNSEKERAKFVQLVSDLKGKANLTEEQKSLLLAQDAIKAQLDKNVALEAEVTAREDARKEAERLAQLDKQFAERARQRTEAIRSSLDSQSDQYDRVRATFGLGDRTRQEVEAQRSIFREYNKMQLDLVKNTPEHLLGSDKFIEESQKIKDGLEAALDAQKQFFADEKAARENWLNGATSALANYIDYIDDAAGRAKSLMSNLLSGGNDVLTEILWSGGKDLSSAKQFGEKIGKQILSGILEQQIMRPITQLLQGQLEDSGSLFSKVFGGLTSNKDTGENWLGFLGLGGGKSGSGSVPRGTTMANPLYVQSVGGAFGAAANDSGGGIAGVLGGLLGGSLSNSFATTAANALPGNALDNLIKLQGGWGSIPGFANGGDPPMGRVSLVGENGPELFVPRQAGTIIPNDVLRRRGGDTYISVPVSGQVDRRTREQIAADISLQQRNARRYG